MTASLKNKNPGSNRNRGAWKAFLLLAVLGFGGGAAAAPFTDLADQAGLIDAGNERGLAWGDFDDDGDPDLFVAVLDGPDRFFRNEGDGSFTEVTGSSGLDGDTRSAAPAWADYDGDGDLDLYVTRVGRNALYRNEGNGTFTDVAMAAGVADSALSWGLAWGDHDGDGTIDLYVANFDIRPNRMYANNGDGTFTDVAAAKGLDDLGHAASATWGDADNDGDPDLFLANKDGANRLYRNDGPGAFTDVAEASGVQDLNDSIGSIWGDCDNDGDLDLFHSANLKPNRLFLNQGGMVFESAVPTAVTAHPGGGRGIGFADYDLDGHLDLYLANSDGPNVLYRNRGQAVFVDVTEGSGTEDPGTGTALAWADYDSDGDPDLFLSNFGQKWRLFANQTSGGNWLTVRLRAPAPNTRALGARVTVHAGDLVMIRENNTGGGYQSQSPHELYFGLGSSSQVDSLTVRWPSGETTSHGPLPANQVLTLEAAR